MNKKTNNEILPSEIVITKIFELRNDKIMLDRDLAILYGIKPIRLREQVKRNISRFPSNFMFQLMENEIDLMVSQNAIPSKRVLGGSSPYAFTEHGILMLANVIKSGKAIVMSIKIIEVFIQMRHMLLAHKDILLKLEEIENKVAGHDEKIKQIFHYLKQLIEKPNPPRQRIGFRRKDE